MLYRHAILAPTASDYMWSDRAQGISQMQHRQPPPLQDAPPSPSFTFAWQLKQHRRAAKLTQAVLAERIGYSAVYISKLEQGQRAPRPDMVEQLAQALGLSPDQLVVWRTAAWQARQPPPAPDISLFRASAPRLVGRSYELGLLDMHLRGSYAPLLVLAGQPGIGKSRLLDEAIGRAQGAGYAVVRGGCRRSSRQEPYSPIADALAEYIALQRRAKRRLDVRGCSWLVKLLPELAEIDPALAPRGSLPTEHPRRLLCAAVRRFLANMAGPQGTLLILDDLHWCGADALDMFSELVDTAHQHSEPPLRLLAAYRDTEIRPADPFAVCLADLASKGLVVHHALGPLTASEATALAEALLAETLQEADIPPAMRACQAERLARWTGGVPFFVVNCALTPPKPPLDAAMGEEAPWDVPWNVTTSIRWRIAALPPAAQEALTVAAVAGRRVSRALLVLAAGSPAKEPHRSLDGLEEACRAGLLVEQPGAETFGVMHDLTRDVVLANLSGVRRQALHCRLAEAIERLPQSEQRAAELAWHFSEAGESARALPYLLQASDHAMSVFAHDDAEHLLRSAVAFAREAGDLTHEGDALERLGDLLQFTGRYESARQAFEAALALTSSASVTAHQEGAALQRGRLLRKIADTYNSQRLFHEAGNAFQMAEEALGPASSKPTGEWWRTWLRIQLHRLLLYYFEAKTSEMVELAQRVQPMMEQHGTLRERSEFHQQLANMRYRQHRYMVTDEALAYAKQAFNEAQRLHDTGLLAERHSTLGFAYLWHGDLSSAEEHLQAALALAERVYEAPSSELHVRCLTYLTVAHRRQGRVEEAQRCAQSSLSMSQEQQLPTYTAMARANFAWVSWRQGRFAEAENYGREALELWGQTNIIYPFHWAALWPLFGAAVVDDRLNEAMVHLHALFAQEQQPLPADLRALVLAVIREWEAGRYDAARTCACEVMAIACKMGYV